VLGRLGDHLGVVGHRVPVEGRQQQLALAHVPLAERGEGRVGADDRPQRRLAGDRRREVLLGEQRLDVVGVVDHGDRLLADERAEAEDVAVLALRAHHEPVLAQRQRQARAQARAGDQRRERELLLGRPGGRFRDGCTCNSRARERTVAPCPRL
jgi:hypothetical protein